MNLSGVNPCGLTLITGEAASGKTTLLRELAGLAQSLGKNPVYLDCGQEMEYGPPSIITEIHSEKVLFQTLNWLTVPVPVFIDGFEFIQCETTALDTLTRLRAWARTMRVPVVVAVSTRKPMSPALPVDEGAADEIYHLTDGYIIRLFTGGFPPVVMHRTLPEACPRCASALNE